MFWIGTVYTIIFMAFMYYISDRVEYLPCVGIYAIGRGLIPCLFPFAGVISIIVNTVIRFIIGLLFVKLLVKLTYSLDDYRVIVAILSFTELVITYAFAFLAASILYNIV